MIIVAVSYYFFPDQKLPANSKIKKIIVFKRKEIMEVYSDSQLLKTYSVSIGRNSTGDKEEEGDKRTPEGTYLINDKNPGSQYHKNLGISHPHPVDEREARKKGVSPGGDIKIHGLRNGLGFIGKFHRLANWTAGCIALTNEEVDELYDHVAIGTPIIILP